MVLEGHATDHGAHFRLSTYFHSSLEPNTPFPSIVDSGMMRSELEAPLDVSVRIMAAASTQGASG
jgi:hypothetical protein